MELEDAANLLKSIVQKTLKANIYRFGFADYTGLGNKTASFGLYNSILTSIKETKTEVVINLAMIEYGQYVETGRIAGKKMVPLNAIIRWIKSRRLKPKDDKSIESMAWGIRTNIQKFGIRPNGQQGKGFLDISLNQFMNDKQLDSLILKWADKQLDIRLNKILY